jgi:small neutral amino acid transporter SnatA (MarC family)
MTVTTKKPIEHTTLIGFALIITGGTLSIYHLRHLMKSKSSRTGLRIAAAIFGGLLISMGANLCADAIHDKVTGFNI